MKSYNLQRTVFLLTLFLMVWLCPAQATDVTVGCAGGIGGQFSSINDALNSLDQFGPQQSRSVELARRTCSSTTETE